MEDNKNALSIVRDAPGDAPGDDPDSERKINPYLGRTLVRRALFGVRLRVCRKVNQILKMPTPKELMEAMSSTTPKTARCILSTIYKTRKVKPPPGWESDRGIGSPLFIINLWLEALNWNDIIWEYRYYNECADNNAVIKPWLTRGDIIERDKREQNGNGDIKCYYLVEATNKEV